MTKSINERAEHPELIVIWPNDINLELWVSAPLDLDGLKDKLSKMLKTRVDTTLARGDLVHQVRFK